MTRGAAANAILDAGRSKKRSLPPPLAPPVPPSRDLSLPPTSLCLSFSLSSTRLLRLFRGTSPLSFFLSSRGGSLFFPPSCRASSTVPTRPHRRCRRWPRGLPLSSLLMPRDRQMMIKKAPVRVRTTPRRARYLRSRRAAFSTTSSVFCFTSSCSSFSTSGDSSSSLPLPILSAALLFFFMPLSYLPLLPPPAPPPLPPCPVPSSSLPPPRPVVPAGRGLSLFFRRLISACSFSLSSSLSPFRLLSSRNFFPSPRTFPPCGYTFVACIMVRGECLRTTCPRFVTDSFAEGR